MWSLLDLVEGDFVIHVLDVGAALCEDPPYKSLVERGRAKVFGFEPDAEECKHLQRTYGGTHQFFPHFAGDGKAATFHETSWALTGSLFEPNTPILEKFQNLAELVTPVAQHAVNTVRIDDIAEIGDIDFIKIDVQGAELTVLQNAQRVLSRTVLIQAEVEFVQLYKNQPMFSDVDGLLRQQGFQFHTFEGFGGRAFKPLMFNGGSNAPLRQFLWADAIYVRDWMRLSELSELKLLKYAVLAHDVVRSYDLAHLALAALDAKTGSNLAGAYANKLLQAPIPR